jgi:hypothetical protein
MVIQSIYSERCLIIISQKYNNNEIQICDIFSSRISSKILIRILFVDVREILKF